MKTNTTVGPDPFSLGTMKWLVLKALTLMVSLKIAAAQNDDDNIISKSGVKSNHGQLKVVETVQNSAYQVLLCVEPHSQLPKGIIAEAPAPPSSEDVQNDTSTTLFSMNSGCREGTVPRLQHRHFRSQLNTTKLHRIMKYAQGGHAVHAGVALHKALENSEHIHGGGAVFQAVKAPATTFTGSSVLQMTFTHGAGTGQHRQHTVEAGINFLPQESKQRELFAFFTNNAHTKYGNWLRGYNDDVLGWVQVDKNIYPDIPINASEATKDIQITYMLHKKNWWLWVQDRYIGYYPGTLFGHSLANGAESASFFGEVFQYKAQKQVIIPMGTGFLLANENTKDCGKAAYIRDMYTIENDYAGNKHKSKQVDQKESGVITDQERTYAVVPRLKSGTDWERFICVGGPKQ